MQSIETPSLRRGLEIEYRVVEDSVGRGQREQGPTLGNNVLGREQIEATTDRRGTHCAALRQRQDDGFHLKRNTNNDRTLLEPKIGTSSELMERMLSQASSTPAGLFLASLGTIDSRIDGPPSFTLVDFYEIRTSLEISTPTNRMSNEQGSECRLRG